MNAKKVDTEIDFRYYLARKHWTDIIITKPIVFTAPVELVRDVNIHCSGIGAAKQEYYANSQHESHLFIVKDGADIVSFNRMMCFGGSKLLSPTWMEDGLQTAVTISNECAAVRFQQCVFDNFNHAGIWQFKSEYVTANGCEFIGAGCNYYNYGIWQGGSSDVLGQSLFLLNSQAQKVRHVIGASGHLNHYYAIRNTIHNTLRHAFDRHNLHEQGFGGLNTIIKNNIFKEENRLAFGVEFPYSNGLFEFTGNTLNHPSTRHIGEIFGARVYEGHIGANVRVQSNRFTDTK